MKINSIPYRTIALSEDKQSVRIIDQRKLPWDIVFAELTSLDEAVTSIREMWVRGAPLIGVTAAYGMYLALKADATDAALQDAYQKLLASRPTAVNLKWALDAMMATLKPLPPHERKRAAEMRATEICEEDVALCKAIGNHGVDIIRALATKKSAGAVVNILTHCNAGWLATVDYGTALAPIYTAHDAGIPVHVWVDETRPRNQGAFLTAFELAQHGVPHTVIVDNAGGLLMRQGRVDMCIVGADRVSSNGDVCNKIGTYLKALAAHDNHIPFYVAFPYTTIDHQIATGEEIPIEEREASEVSHLWGKGTDGKVCEIALTRSPVANPGFDITPSRLVTGYITEKGVMNNIDMTPISKAV